MNGILSLLDVLLLISSLGLGIYYGWKLSKGKSGFYLLFAAQRFAVWVRSFFIKAAPPSIEPPS